MNIENGKPKPAAFKIGHRQGTLTVIRYIGHAATRPDNGKILVQAMHWYEVRCDCGNEVVVNQGNLRGGKQTCDVCNRRQRSEQKKGKPIHVKYAWKESGTPAEVMAALKGKW